MTDTQRTATEQLLISNAVDHAVSSLDFRSLAGKPVYFDTQYLDNAVDRGYLISSLRQHLLASGCQLQEDRAKAVYVVEARSGGIGTDRHSLLVGIPQTQVPAFVPGQPTQIPEIPLAKKTDQRGVAKIAVFAFNRLTGRPVWQSGVVQASSSSKDLWLFGTGPFQNGTIRQGTSFAGLPLALPSFGEVKDEDEPARPVIPVTEAAAWTEPPPSPRQVTGLLGALGTPNPLMLTALLRAHADSAAVTADARGAPPASPPAKGPASHSVAAVPVPAPAPNAGGQAETEPSKVLSSGAGFKPDG